MTANSYPDDWPACVFCGEPAMDGHLTCGRATCNESEARHDTHTEPDYGGTWDGFGVTSDADPGL